MKLPENHAPDASGHCDEFDWHNTADFEGLPHGDPTPEEIEERTAQVRRDWSESEHRRRAEITSQTKWVLTNSRVLVLQYGFNDASEAT